MGEADRQRALRRRVQRERQVHLVRLQVEHRIAIGGFDICQFARRTPWRCPWPSRCRRRSIRRWPGPSGNTAARRAVPRCAASWCGGRGRSALVGRTAPVRRPIKPAAGNSAAAPASARRPSRVVMVWCLPVSTGRSSMRDAIGIQSPFQPGNAARCRGAHPKPHVLPLTDDRRRHPARQQRGWHRLAHPGPDLHAAAGDGEQLLLARAAAARHLRAAAHPSDAGRIHLRVRWPLRPGARRTVGQCLRRRPDPPAARHSAWAVQPLAGQHHLPVLGVADAPAVGPVPGDRQRAGSGRGGASRRPARGEFPAAARRELSQRRAFTCSRAKPAIDA